jgi:alcohol dehydrogenase
MWRNHHNQALTVDVSTSVAAQHALTPDPYRRGSLRNQQRMGMQYRFLAPGQVVFGWGQRSHIGELVRPWGDRAFVVCGSRTLEELGWLTPVWESLAAAGVSVERWAGPRQEPLVSDVDQLVAAWRAAASSTPSGRPPAVVAIGGGSTLDLAKAAAAVAAQPEQRSVIDYLEGVGCGATLSATPWPMIAVPTTAGTGSEATKNAVISSHTPSFKKSLRSDAMLPKVVLIDPELTVPLPFEWTAATGLDAITQLLESAVSCRAAPLPSALCREGLHAAWTALPRALADGSDRAAREAMAHAAFLSGVALANAGLGVAHGVAAALGVIASVPHGVACAVMLPTALRLNRTVSRQPLADIATGLLKRRWPTDEAAVSALIEAVTELCRHCRIPSRLRDLGLALDQIPALVAGSQGNSLSGNPRPIDRAELQAVLEELW